MHQYPNTRASYVWFHQPSPTNDRNLRPGTNWPPRSKRAWTAYTLRGATISELGGWIYRNSTYLQKVTRGPSCPCGARPGLLSAASKLDSFPLPYEIDNRTHSVLDEVVPGTLDDLVSTRSDVCLNLIPTSRKFDEHLTKAAKTFTYSDSGYTEVAF